MEFYAKNRAMQVLTQATSHRTATLASLGAAADQLLVVAGQRLLVLFSEGFTSVGRAGSSQTHDIQTAINRAVRAGVVIYSIDASGMLAPAVFDASFKGLSVDSANFSSLMSNVSNSEEDFRNSLNALAKDTGGEAFFRSNDLGGSLRSILDSNQQYYVLAYYPPDQKDSKRYRRIEVMVKGHPDYLVRAQRGYYFEDLSSPAVKSRASAAQDRLLEALYSPIPRTGLAVSASADYFEWLGDSSQVTVSAFIAGDRLSYEGTALKPLLKLHVATVVLDEGGRTVSNTIETLTGRIDPGDLSVAKRHGFLHQKRISLAPGLYQIRIGVMEPDSERIGTVSALIEVPNLSLNSLAMSSLFISRDQSSPGERAASVAAEDAAQPAQSRDVRSFSRGESVIYYFRIYNVHISEAEPSGLIMQLEFMLGEVPVIWTEWQPVDSRVIGKDKIGVDVGGQLAVDSLPVGTYEARMTVKDSQTGRLLQRSATIQVLDE